MISFRIEAGDRLLPWTAAAGRWAAGRSWVQPFEHPALECCSLVSPDRLAFIVRERGAMTGRLTGLEPQRVDEQAWDEQLAAALQWPLNVSVLTWRTDAAGSVLLRCGGWGTAPVCLAVQRDTLHGHWDPAQLYRFLQGGVDFGRAAYLLARIGAPYSRRTLFPGMQLLTERACADWDPERHGLRIDYPQPMPVAGPRTLRADADVLGSFEALLGASITRWLDPGRDVFATELSGGLDSAVVGLVAAKLSGRPVRSYGLIVPDETGRVQTRRRQLIVERLGALDSAIDASRHTPFSSPRHEGDDAIVPWGEFYHEAFLALLRRARGHGVHTILTGIGGDEISTLAHDELDPRRPAPMAEPALPSYLSDRALQAFREVAQHGLDCAPNGAAVRSVFEAAQAGTAVYLRAGVWPLYPYATPELVEFCRSLPAEWRRGRRLQREYLARHGLPQEVYRPELPESFIPLLDQAMRRDARKTIEALFQDSLLADAGLVDTPRLLAAYRRYCSGEDLSESDFLLEAVVLELTLRTLQAGTERQHEAVAA
ncbi:hypothetical protein CKO44_09145 [Rubrivivax gelatinosus]|uniref:asparagine synthase-related protein n=1 Tax=Rubrivivax gelatinosus TaxID=28068 RepID=UPI0019063AF4|nr:asparagine synthase-related protein [Rubrivivax gelatinosus]MBK1613634.1 hypothetical protein [Rubrivivax gelatinosus]